MEEKQKMGRISKATFKKLTLLYLVANFKDGAYSSYRVQKVLYFGTKYSKVHPFLFRHTTNGQYSKEARENLNALVSIGLLQMTGLPVKEDSGARWVINPEIVEHKFLDAFLRIASALSESITETVQNFGYLKNDEIKKMAEDDDLLKATPFGQVLFDENLPQTIEVDLPEDLCEDLEFVLNEHFIKCTDQIVKGIEQTDFDIGQVKKVGSFL